ncbi:MAG: hypothetical protein AABZ45_02230 [Pseudomonadota bacterium]
MSLAAIEMIIEFSETQADLCRELVAQYGLSSDEELITLVPKKGQLTLEGQLWSFARHGLGVLFSSQSDSRIIDAHERPVSLPQALDAWRLMQFFEALNIENVEAGGTNFPVGSRVEVGELLTALVNEGSLSGVADQPNMFVLPLR